MVAAVSHQEGGHYTHNMPFLCREDLRHLPICSVDPPGCKDIDDALHIRPLPNGTLELGVHIADVTNFLHSGTAMDTEAASRQDQPVILHMSYPAS